jgi:hypothetical protein
MEKKIEENLRSVASGFLITKEMKYRDTNISMINEKPSGWIR